jgi:hypothetical protein
MRWFRSSIRNSFYAILAVVHPQEPEETIRQYTLEDIRETMLALVGDGDLDFKHVTRRIHYAVDIQALWYLRGDAMAVLSARHGEAVALEKIEALTEMFEDHLPRGLRSRPSPLNALPKKD